LLGCLLVPLLCLPLKKPSVLVIASIPFLFICEWNNPNVKSICFWYQTGLLPILFWALIEALRDVSTKEALSARRAVPLAAEPGPLGTQAFQLGSLVRAEFLALSRRAGLTADGRHGHLQNCAQSRNP